MSNPYQGIVASGSALLLSAVVALADGPVRREAVAFRTPPTVELAGHSLSDTPHFEYVAAYHEDEAVEMALDPRRHRLAGRKCDVYVTRSKSPDEWRDDPTLHEVRETCPTVETNGVTCPGGAPPCSCRFDDACGLDEGDACEFEDFAAPLVEPGELSSRAEPCYRVEVDGQRVTRCAGLGAGYDVVLDCDRDGTLGATDFIDGFDKEAGFYRVHDTTESAWPAACADYDVEGLPDLFRAQRAWFPRDVDRMGRLPLVVISHGRGHEWTWYTYLQEHLASYGFIVMSHQNQVHCSQLPYEGCHHIDAASETTLRHTDALLDLLLDPECSERVESLSCGDEIPTVDLCRLSEHIDPDRIVLIGHSRGGNGSVWAYDRLVDGSFVPEHFDETSIRLISSMAPTDLPIGEEGEYVAHPLTVPYHLIYGAADNDVGGRPHAPNEHGFHIFERARGRKQSVYLHGVGHGWFHDQCDSGGHPGCDFTSLPDELLIDRERTNLIVRGYYVPLVKHYTEGNIPARDYLWRPWERFRPPQPELDPAGDSRIAVVLDYQQGDGPHAHVIDDHESNPLPHESSSGGEIRHGLAPDGVFEGTMRDEDCSFEWNRPLPDTGGPCGCQNFAAGPCRLRCTFVAAQPMNGMSRSREPGDARAVFLQWQDDPVRQPYYELDVVEGERNLRERKYLSLRAAMVPRHPSTLPRDDLDFFVALVDGQGRTSRIRVGTYGSGVQSPYDRTDPLGIVACTLHGECGTAFCCPRCNPLYSEKGWQSEFESFRIRLTDFQHDVPDLDLGDVTSVRLELTAPGSTDGAMVVDDIAFTSE